MSTLQYSEVHAWVRVKGAFFPDVIEARPGERLRLVVRREETAPCSERLLIASLGKSVMLPPFEDVAVDLGPVRCPRETMSSAVSSTSFTGGSPCGKRRWVRGSPRRKGWFTRMAQRLRESYTMSEGRFKQMKRPTINITPPRADRAHPYRLGRRGRRSHPARFRHRRTNSRT